MSYSMCLVLSEDVLVTVLMIDRVHNYTILLRFALRYLIVRRIIINLFLDDIKSMHNIIVFCIHK